MRYFYKFNLLFFIFFLIQTTSVIAQEKTDNQCFTFDTIAHISSTAVKDQYKSGTCWSFAATSFVETEILRMGGEALDLSEMFFVYHAYQSKAQRFVRLHGKSNFGPGGQAHDVMNIIRKQGMLKESDYPALVGGFDNHVHGELDNVLNAFVSEVVKNPSGKLSESWSDGYTGLLNAYLHDPVPMQKTAKALLKSTSFNPDDYVELTSYTMAAYYKPFMLEVPDNWSFDLYYNIPLDELMSVIKSALQSGYSVCWDGDVSNQGFSHAKSLAIVPETKIENMTDSERAKWEKLSENELLRNSYSFSKPVVEVEVTEIIRQKAFDNYEVTDDHLMHLTGLLKDQNGTFYYLTKNSWAEKSNAKGGFLNMSEAYLRLNTVAIMVHKNALPEELKKKLGLN